MEGGGGAPGAPEPEERGKLPGRMGMCSETWRMGGKAAGRRGSWEGVTWGEVSQTERARRLPMCKGEREQLRRLDRQVSDLGLVLFG